MTPMNSVLLLDRLCKERGIVNKSKVAFTDATVKRKREDMEFNKEVELINKEHLQDL